MPRIKPHLKHLHRTQTDGKSRRGYLRLDKNEGVPGLPEDLVKDILSEINPEYLATYPEYRILQEKVAIHNKLKPENVILSNGSDAAIKYIFDAYISPGDKILLTDPTFAMFSVYCNMFNAKSVIVEYKPDLSFPKKEFMNRISPDIKMAVVVNPNNPTGYASDQNELNTIITKTSKEGVLTIVDEAYFYFYPESVIKEVTNYKNLIVLRTFSKLFGLAAVRLGYAAACPEIIEHLRKVKSMYDVNGLAVLFAEKILDNPDIIQDLIEFANEGKKYLSQKLRDYGIEYKEGWANFVLIKCGHRVDEIVRKLAEKNILVSGGFKQNFLKDYIRVTIGNKMIMEQFWDSFIKIWKA